MFSTIQTWIFPALWSLAGIGVGAICGFFAGKAYALYNEPRRLKRNRERTTDALTRVIDSTEQLSNEVTNHKAALEGAETVIRQCDSNQQFVEAQAMVIQNIRNVVEANKKMENDLIVSKFQLENAAQELDRSRKEARTDVLCKVANRQAVDETLKFMVSRYRSQQTSFGLMLIDIDHFKQINDKFGHEAGDEILVSVGKALKECVRPEDFVGRIGGDEFVLMLEGLKESSADLVCERIRSTIETYNFSVGKDGESTAVTLSMGLAVINQEDDAKSLYRRADQALGNSREGGSGKVSHAVEEQGTAETNDTPEKADTFEKPAAPAAPAPEAPAEQPPVVDSETDPEAAYKKLMASVRAEQQ